MTTNSKPANLFVHLFKGSLLYGSSDIIVALVRFALITVYTRILLPQEFGLYAVITTTLTLAIVLLPLGIPSVVMMRFKSESPIASKGSKDCAFWFLIQISAVAGFVFYGITFFCFPKTQLTDLAPWLIIYVASEIVSMIPKSSLRYKEKIISFSIARGIRVLSMAVILLLLIHFRENGLKTVIISETAAVFLECLLCMIFDRYIPKKPSFSMLASLIGAGLPLFAVGFGLFCIDLSDRYAVYLLMGQQAMGYYAAAAKIAIIASFFSEAFNSMWFPYYLRTASFPGEVSKTLPQFSSRLVMLFALVISACMLILPLFVHMHIGAKYFIAPQYQLVSILVAPLVLSYFFKTAFYIASPILISTGKNWFMARVIYIAAFINIAGDIILAVAGRHADLFFILTLIALMTSVSYAICMICISHKVNLFHYSSWFSSKTIWYCAGLLGIPFLPVNAMVLFSVWVGYVLLALGKWYVQVSKSKRQIP